MTGHDHDPEHDGVRRLLADVPPPGPPPDDGVARLDAQLAELVSQRAEPGAPASAPVADLAQERARRRRWRTGLVAAASIAVLGVGVGIVADDLTLGSSGSEDSMAGDAGGDTMARELQEAPGAAQAPSDEDAPKAFDSGGGAAAEVRRLPVRSATLADDVARIAARPALDRAGSDVSGNAFRALAPCVVPSLSRGAEAVPVRFDGEDATLVLRAPSDGAREAQIYACDTGDTLLAQTTVPTR